MIDFIGRKKIFYITALIIIAVGAVALIARGGLNLDLDFVGGTSMTYELGVQFDNSDVENLVREVNGGTSVIVQKVGLAGTEVSIRTKELTSEERQSVTEKMAEKFELPDLEPTESTNVGASTSTRLIYEAGQSILYAVVFMLLYITFRFDFKSGLAAVVALIVNILVMISFYAIFDIPVNTTFIAAILTIVGYSINDTIVVFDKIRENAKFARKETFAVTANKSINQTLGRTINTSITTLITITVLYIMGVPAVKEFALPIIVGVVVGTFSSICIASPTWVVARDYFKMRAKAKAQK